MVCARVAQSPLGLDALRSGVAVGAVGGSQLAGRQHRLAVALAGLAGGLGVAPVLALVIGGDPVQPEAWMEGPAPEGLGLGGLDADTEADHAVHFRVREGQME